MFLSNIFTLFFPSFQLGAVVTVGACSISASGGAQPSGATVSGDWAMLSLQFAIVGICMAFIPPVGCRLYPAHVRASGFNLAHNIAFGLVGGLTPMTITAIQLSPAISRHGNAGSVWAVGVWLSAAAVGTVIGCVGLLWICPRAQYTEGVWGGRSLHWPRCRSVLNQ